MVAMGGEDTYQNLANVIRVKMRPKKTQLVRELDEINGGDGRELNLKMMRSFIWRLRNVEKDIEAPADWRESELKRLVKNNALAQMSLREIKERIPGHGFSPSEIDLCYSERANRRLRSELARHIGKGQWLATNKIKACIVRVAKGEMAMLIKEWSQGVKYQKDAKKGVLETEKENKRMKEEIEGLLMKAKEADDERERSEARNSILTANHTRIVNLESNGNLSFRRAIALEARLRATSVSSMKAVLARWSRDELKISLLNWHDQIRQAGDKILLKEAKMAMEAQVFELER